jgi:hypothetical protein
VSVPTVSQFFQPPLYWQQFEDLAHGLLGEVYSSLDAQQFGRPGQAQDGVDVFGRSKRYGIIGVQCKRLSDLDENGSPFPGGPVTRKLLRQEAAKSLGFKAKLSIWIFATTARRDTAVQNWVNELNEEWEADNRNCRAMVWSWDDIVGYLNGFPDLQRWYYEAVIKAAAPKIWTNSSSPRLGWRFRGLRLKCRSTARVRTNFTGSVGHPARRSHR